MTSDRIGADGFTPAEWERLEEQGLFMVRRTWELAAIDLWGNFRKETPVRTGRLAGSWMLEQRGEDWAVTTDVLYAPFVAFGTLPHVIVPRNAQALRFVVNGQVVFARRVNHPGTPANLFWQRSIEATEGRLPDFAQRSLREWDEAHAA